MTTNSKWRKEWMKELDAPIPQTILMVLLLMSLFIAESWTLGNAPDSSNDALYAILTAIFAIFCVEIVALCILQADYVWSFFFWMDVIGTASIILDIGWITDHFLPSGALSGQGSVIRATRAAKLGARYGRLLRLMRMMKLNSVWRFCFGGGEEQEVFEPTMTAIKRVSNRLSSMLSQRTAALTMLLVIVVPFLSYTVTETSPEAWVTNFKVQAKNESVTSYDLQNLARKCRNYYEPKDRQLRYLYVESPYVATVEEAYDTRNTMRSANIYEYSSYYYVSTGTLLASGNPFAEQYAANGTANQDSLDRAGYVRFSVRVDMDDTVPAQQNAMFGILIILLVIIVLVGFTASYASSVNNLVVQPMEKMMVTLRASALMMINALKQLERSDEENKDGGAGAGADGGSNAQSGDVHVNSSDEEDDPDMEAAMLEEMVAKLSRIVRHVLPHDAMQTLDSSVVDANTSNWLSQAYSAGAHVQKNLNFLRTVRAKNSDEESSVDLSYQLLSAGCKATKLELNSWAFDALEYTNTELIDSMTYMFSLLHLLQELQVSVPVFKAFLGKIAGRYLDNSYHNFKHGCDVCHTAYRLIMVAQLHLVFTPLEVFALLIGAVAHDVGHPGVNNLFLIKTGHTLALQHNDRSPLENMHCSALYQITSNNSSVGYEDSNIFKNLSEPEWREVRKIILTIILGTDMSHHFEQISKTQLFLEVHGEDTQAFCAGAKDQIECLSDDKNRLFILELMLHSSDISNPFKPFEVCAKWADLVVEEFCLQGDKEKELGIEVSPMCDRDLVVLSNMQMGFIEFVVAPLIIALVNVFPTLHEIGSTMKDNYLQWGEKRLDELSDAAPSESDAADPTYSKPHAPESNQPDTASGASSPTLTLTPPTLLAPTLSIKAPSPHRRSYGAHEDEAHKLQERMEKFKDKMSFIAALAAGKQRKRISFLKK